MSTLEANVAFSAGVEGTSAYELPAVLLVYPRDILSRGYHMMIPMSVLDKALLVLILIVAHVPAGLLRPSKIKSWQGLCQGASM